MTFAERKPPSGRPRRLTRLGRFIRDDQLELTRLADLSGISSQHLQRLRYGRSEPTRPLMIWLTLACRRLVADRPEVRITELFDLGDGEH